MSSPRAEIFERLANQSEQFLSGWAEKEQAGLKTFKRIWRLKELAYRPIEEFPDLAERFRLFEQWLGDEGMELAASPLTRYQMEEVSAALEKLKLFLPRNGEGAEGASGDQLSELADKFVSRLTGREAVPSLDSAQGLRRDLRPTFSAETEYSFVINRSGEGSAPLDPAPSTALGTSRDESEQAARDKPPPTGDLSEDF